MVTMTTMLVSVAELSNIFSVLAVLVCFCAMILFITRNMMVIRVHDDDMMFPSLHQSVGPRIPQMKMMKVHIPFTFKIIETSKSTYAEVQVTVSSQVRYSFRAYWGVNIRELHVALWRPWAALRDSALDGTLLTGHYQQPGPIERRDPHVDRTLTLKLPAPPLALGTPPRLAYPLVIFLMRTAESPDSVHPDETVALVNVVHIKDTVCTLPTSVLAQYLKQANGQLSCLKQLYLATGNPVNYDDEHLQMRGSDAVQVTSADHRPATAGGMALGEPMACAASHSGPTTLLCTSDDNGTVWNANGEQLCVVCQYFPLSRALLPCRHTCICASCFGKLDRCPMCRSPIKSYFCIRGEDYMPDCGAKGGNTTPKGLEPGSPLFNWFDSWNDRLTDFLGFQR